ncbi:MAG: hypothetical protein E7645_03025 [Ruminococcaceae bacterium]|nr:hypothetical protein [Oscillospiraceae bacterium]
MHESNTYEYVVNEKPAGTRKLKKTLCRIGVLSVPVGFFILCLAFQLYPVAILPLSFIGVVLYFWKLFNVELEYSMTSGIMTFSRINGGMRRKKVLELHIKDMREIAPYTEEAQTHLETMSLTKNHVFVSSMSAADIYYALFEKDGDLQVVYFEATEKALHILRYYNGVTKMSKVSR